MNSNDYCIIYLSESCPRVGIDVRRWSHGCYTLIRDDTMENKCALDANLFINVSDKWSQEHGGFISYIAKDEDEEVTMMYSYCFCKSFLKLIHLKMHMKHV